MGGVLYYFHLIKEISFVKRNVFTPLESPAIMAGLSAGNARLPEAVGIYAFPTEGVICQRYW